MLPIRFNTPLGESVGDGYSVQLDAVTPNRSGAPVANVQLYNGVGIFSDDITLTSHTHRRRFVRAAVARVPSLKGDTVDSALNALAFAVTEALRRRDEALAGTAATDQPTREQLSLTPPGFVCVALDDDGRRVYVLRGDDGALSVAPSAIGSYKGETVTHVPPPGLPWELPRAGAILTHYAELQREGAAWTARLLADLEAWHRDASDLGRDGAYLLLALNDLLTYIPLHTDYLPIILLEAEPERGKTRTGQAAAYVCRHGVHLQGIREANLLRAASDREAMLFIDLMNVWETAKREKCEDIVLGRWERGGTVERVMNPDAGPFADTVSYSVYGPTIIATNEPIHRILDTRCLRVDMPLARRQFTGRIRPADALPLVERLMAWRALMFPCPLPESPLPADGRLGDILRPLKQVLLAVAPDRRGDFDGIVAWQSTRRRDELAQSWEADIVAAIQSSAVRVAHDYLSIAQVRETFNNGRPEAQQRTAHWLGKKIRALGWTVDRVGHGNVTSLLWDDDLLARLTARYGQAEASPTGADHVNAAHPPENASHASHASPGGDGNRAMAHTIPGARSEVTPHVAAALSTDEGATATSATHATRNAEGTPAHRHHMVPTCRECGAMAPTPGALCEDCDVLLEQISMFGREGL